MKIIHKIKFILSFFCFMLIFFSTMYGQDNDTPQKNNKSTKLGIHFSPLIPNKFLQKTNYNTNTGICDYNIDVLPSYQTGIEIRYDFTKRFALNSGINFIKRNYKQTVKHLNYSEDTITHFTAYEIPLVGLLYVQMSELWYMNMGYGLCVSFFPTETYTNGAYVENYIKRRNWLHVGMNALVGWEYRSYDYGTFYFGMAYQRYHKTMAFYNIQFENQNMIEITQFLVKGSYFALNFKYYFPQN